MIFTDLESWIGRHFVFERVFILRIITEEYILINVQNTVLNILLTKSSKQLSIKVIGDSTTIKDLAYDIFQHSSINLLNLSLLLRSHVG